MFTKIANKVTNLEEKEKKGLLARLIQGGVGAGMINSYGSLADAAVRGKKDFYHGVSSTGGVEDLSKLVKSINEKGIDINQAGKAGRINAIMARNSMVNLIQDVAPNLYKDKSKFDMFVDSLSNVPTHTEDGYINTLAKKTQEFLKSNGAPEVPKETMENYLRERGKRVYLSNTPRSALQWSNTSTELENAFNLISNKSRAKTYTRLLDGTFLGGLGGLAVNEAAPRVRNTFFDRIKANKTKADISSNDLSKYLSDGDKIVYRTTVGKPHIKTIGVMKDFPGLAPILGALPAARATAADLVPHLYSAGRDVSVGASMSPKELKEMLVYDKDHKLKTIIKNTGYQAPRAAGLAHRAKAGFKPLVFGGLGADLISRAITDKGLYAHGQDIAGKLKKQAAIANSTKNALRTGLYGGGIGAGLGTVGHFSLKDQREVLNKLDRARDKMVEKYVNEGEPRVQAESKATAKLALPATMSTFPIAINQPLQLFPFLGATGGLMAVSKGALPEKLTLPLSTTALYGGIGMYSQIPSDIERDLNNTYEVTKKDKYGVIPSTIAGGALGTLAYNLKKNYGHSTSSIGKAFRELKDTNSTTRKIFSRRNVIPAAILGTILGGAGNYASGKLSRILADKSLGWVDSDLKDK